MAYVIAEPCIGTKDTACVDACPVDCIHPKKDDPKFESVEMLHIEPVECIEHSTGDLPGRSNRVDLDTCDVDF